jgi:hypothetical protein
MFPDFRDAQSCHILRGPKIGELIYKIIFAPQFLSSNGLMVVKPTQLNKLNIVNSRLESRVTIRKF